MTSVNRKSMAIRLTPNSRR